MMIRLPDFDLLRDTWGQRAAEENLFTLINLLSTFIMRYRARCWPAITAATLPCCCLIVR